MTEEVVEYLPDGGMIVRNTPPAELAEEEERRCILRRLCALEDRLDILEAQHRKLPALSSEKSKPALSIDRPLAETREDAVDHARAQASDVYKRQSFDEWREEMLNRRLMPCAIIGMSTHQHPMVRELAEECERQELRQAREQLDSCDKIHTVTYEPSGDGED